MADKQHTDNKNGKRTLIILAVMLLILIGAVAAASGNKEEKPTESVQVSQSENNKDQPEGKIGAVVRDGKFEFNVSSVDCGKTEIVSPESDMLKKTAQGQFCVVKMNVKNVGNEQQGFFALNQKMLDESNKQYSTDDIASGYAVPSSQMLSWAQINPGNNVDAVIVFDIPKDVKPAKLELHDSLTSNGVKVGLL